ncbi:hypothetical protein WG66_002289 [Moniliophthora roreri]|nr:hypothetical protein WG66_002289 [Moniliophthora roreri]
MHSDLEIVAALNWNLLAWALFNLPFNVVPSIFTQASLLKHALFQLTSNTRGTSGLKPYDASPLFRYAFIAPMAFFQGTCNIHIHGGKFTNIQGSRYINQFNGILVQERDRTIWDDMRSLFSIHFSQSFIPWIAVSSTNSFDHAIYILRDSLDLETGRTKTVARIRGEEKDKDLLYVGYSGPYAYKGISKATRKNLDVRQATPLDLQDIRDVTLRYPSAEQRTFVDS